MNQTEERISRLSTETVRAQFRYLYGNEQYNSVYAKVTLMTSVGNAVFVTLIGALSSRASGGIPNLFGKAPIGVLTNSMHGDKPDSFDEGDLIICDKGDNGDTEFMVGDVVTFMQDISGDGNRSRSPIGSWR